MDYSIPKTLPVTGAGFLIGGSLTNQLFLACILFVAVFIAATLIRVLFRHHKKLNER